MTCEDACPKYYVLNSSISEHEQKQCFGTCPKSNMFLATNGKECLTKCDFYAVENGIYLCKESCTEKYELANSA